MVEKQGLRMNMNKIKYLVTGKEANENVKSGRWPCGCCKQGIEANSILCS